MMNNKKIERAKFAFKGQFYDKSGNAVMIKGDLIITCSGGNIQTIGKQISKGCPECFENFTDLTVNHNVEVVNHNGYE